MIFDYKFKQNIYRMMPNTITLEINPNELDVEELEHQL